MNILKIISVLGSVIYILAVMSGVQSYDRSFIPELGLAIAISTLILLVNDTSK